jgi:hypothetical protein
MPTSVCDRLHSTALKATSCISEPSRISRKCSERPVKVLTSSAMRWSGLSISSAAMWK